MYGDYIFWTDWVRRAVLRADKYTGGDMKVLRADIPQQPMGIVAVANDTNSCTYYSFTENTVKFLCELHVAYSGKTSEFFLAMLTA